jgi:hypothetical protein
MSAESRLGGGRGSRTNRPTAARRSSRPAVALGLLDLAQGGLDPAGWITWKTASRTIRSMSGEWSYFVERATTDRQRVEESLSRGPAFRSALVVNRP